MPDREGNLDTLGQTRTRTEIQARTPRVDRGRTDQRCADRAISTSKHMASVRSAPWLGLQVVRPAEHSDHQRGDRDQPGDAPGRELFVGVGNASGDEQPPPQSPATADQPTQSPDTQHPCRPQPQCERSSNTWGLPAEPPQPGCVCLPKGRDLVAGVWVIHVGTQRAPHRVGRHSPPRPCQDHAIAVTRFVTRNADGEDAGVVRRGSSRYCRGWWRP